MKSELAPPNGTQPDGSITIGRGWQWPAVFVGLFVAIFYVPSHSQSGSGIDAVIAAAAALYAVGLSVVVPRLLRGLILRAGGSKDPIVVLGRGPDLTIAESIRPRRRLAAIAVGTVVSAGAALAAARLVLAADPATYAHATASLAVGVNAAIAAAVLVPVPGLAGWAVLLGLVDAGGTPPDRRVPRAAWLARAMGIPFLILGGIVASLLGDPMLTTVAFVLAYFTWTGTALAVGRDATTRFLSSHRAGEVGRPVISRAAPDDPLDDLLARRPTQSTVTVVENGPSGVLGAIGPRQIAAHRSSIRDLRCRDVMAPLADLRPVAASVPAAELLPRIVASGFALVWGPDGPGYVEASDLAAQVRVWAALRERGRARSGTPGRAAPAGKAARE